MSASAIERSLVDAGVPPEKARVRALELSGDLRATNGRSGETNQLAGATKPPIRATIAWPVRLTLPWSYLVSDNDKFRAKLITVKGEPKAIMVITREYAAATEKIANVARAKIDTAEPHNGPCAIAVKVWMPDERPHDQVNFAKLIHDALEGVVYQNDRWIHDAHWIRAGVDVDAPRAEITVTPQLP